MYPDWEHWRDLKGTCPVCGKPSHVGVSMRTGRYYWLHDDYDIREYYREHGKHSSLAEISFDVFQEMTRCAREHGIEPVATIGGAEARASRKPRRKGMGKGAAAPPFPCLFCSRTDRISVLTGQGRSSSCKIWEVGTQSPLTWTFQPSSILLPSGFRSLDGRALSLEKTGNLGFPVFCSQQSDYPISCHLQMAAAQFALSVLRIMERRELRDA